MVKISEIKLSETFDLSIFEYHSTHESLQKGYIFALFSLKESSVEEMSNVLADAITDSSTIPLAERIESGQECLDQLRSIKVKKNLGSVVAEVSNFSLDGYSVRYEYGDICDAELDSGDEPIRYSSEIIY